MKMRVYAFEAYGLTAERNFLEPNADCGNYDCPDRGTVECELDGGLLIEDEDDLMECAIDLLLERREQSVGVFAYAWDGTMFAYIKCGGKIYGHTSIGNMRFFAEVCEQYALNCYCLLMERQYCMWRIVTI